MVPAQLTASKNIPSVQNTLNWRLVCLLFACSVMILALCGRFVRWDAVFVDGLSRTLNDQVGYISVARNLVDSGTMTSSLIYPSTLSENASKNYLYLPGHYLALAAVYRMFGFSAAHSFWPSLAAFLLSSILTVVIASMLFGRSLALPSWLLFVFFPLNLAYAFTAMAEMTVMASVLLALAVFLWLPLKWKIWLGPATLAIPLLFRETGVVIAVVMAGVIYKQSGGRWASVVRFCVLSALVTVLVLLSPISKGRPSLIARNVLGGTFESIYTDATFSSKLHPTAATWVAAIGKKFVQNAEDLLNGSSPSALPDSREVRSLYFIAAGIPLALWLWWRKKDPLYVSIFLMLACLLCAILGLYTVWIFRGVRVLLLAQPLAAMLWAAFLADLWGVFLIPRPAAWLAAALWMTLSVVSVYFVFDMESQINTQATHESAFLESLKPDPHSLLVSPWNISLDFVLKHHPAEWAFVPANDETLRMLNGRYPVGTLVIDSTQATDLTTAAIASLGLVEQDDHFFRRKCYRIFQRPSDRGSQNSSSPSRP